MYGNRIIYSTLSAHNALYICILYHVLICMLTMGVKFGGINCGFEVLEAVVYKLLQPSEKKNSFETS